MSYVIIDKGARAANLAIANLIDGKGKSKYGYPAQGLTTNYTKPIVHPTLPKIALPVLDNFDDELGEDVSTIPALGGLRLTLVAELTPDWYGR